MTVIGTLLAVALVTIRCPRLNFPRTTMVPSSSRSCFTADGTIEITRDRKSNITRCERKESTPNIPSAPMLAASSTGASTLRVREGLISRLGTFAVLTGEAPVML